MSVTCTVCKGKKTQTTTTVEWGTKKETVFETTCIGCWGTGEISEADAKAIEAEKAMWCKCTGETGTKYHPDTKRMKHHYTCTTCKKIKQIG